MRELNRNHNWDYLGAFLKITLRTLSKIYDITAISGCKPTLIATGAVACQIQS